MKITNDNYKTYSVINFKNVYLDNNRVIKMKQVDKYIKKISREAAITDLKESIKNFIKGIFKINKEIEK